MKRNKPVHNNQRKRVLQRNKARIANRRHLQFTLEQAESES